MAIGKENKSAWISFFGSDKQPLKTDVQEKKSTEDKTKITDNNTEEVYQHKVLQTHTENEQTATGDQQPEHFIKENTKQEEKSILDIDSENDSTQIDELQQAVIKHIVNFGEVLVSEEIKQNQIEEIIVKTLKKEDIDNKLISIDFSQYEAQKRNFSYIQYFEYQIKETSKQLGAIQFIYKQKPMIFAKSFVIYGGSDLDKINWKQTVTAYDSEDGNLSQEVICDYHAVNPLKDGVYPVTYSVINSNGETGKLIFWVKVEILPPKLTADDITMTASKTPNQRLLMAQVKAIDVIDGELINQVVVDDSQVDYERAGSYSVIYQVKNSFGLESIVKKRLTIEAQEPDLIIKALHLKATKDPREIDWLEYASASDPIDGDISNLIAVDNHQVDLQHDGTYPIAYRVENQNGKVITARTTVTIVVPRPEIEATTFEIERGSDLTQVDWLNHVKAIDEDGRDLTEFVTTFYEDINPDEPGEYPLYYLVRNSYQQQAMKRVTVAVK